MMVVLALFLSPFAQATCLDTFEPFKKSNVAQIEDPKKDLSNWKIKVNRFINSEGLLYNNLIYRLPLMALQVGDKELVREFFSDGILEKLVGRFDVALYEDLALKSPREQVDAFPLADSQAIVSLMQRIIPVAMAVEFFSSFETFLRESGGKRSAPWKDLREKWRNQKDALVAKMRKKTRDSFLIDLAAYQSGAKINQFSRRPFVAMFEYGLRAIDPSGLDGLLSGLDGLLLEAKTLLAVIETLKTQVQPSPAILKREVNALGELGAEFEQVINGTAADISKLRQKYEENLSKLQDPSLPVLIPDERGYIQGEWSEAHERSFAYAVAIFEIQQITIKVIEDLPKQLRDARAKIYPKENPALNELLGLKGFNETLDQYFEQSREKILTAHRASIRKAVSRNDIETVERLLAQHLATPKELQDPEQRYSPQSEEMRGLLARFGLR